MIIGDLDDSRSYGEDMPMIEYKFTLKQKFILWTNRLRLDYMIKKKGRFIEIIVNERQKRNIKAFKIFFTFLGLISAFIIFQSLIISFVFGLIVYLITTLLDRILFSYSSAYIHPMPNFQLDPEKWLGVFFGYVVLKENHQEVPLVGLVLSDEKYARNIHSLLLSWSYGNLRDNDNNICTSVILDGVNEYVFYCYPNYERKTAKRFADEIEANMKALAPNDIHHKTAILQVLGRRCDITAKSYLPTFIDRYRPKTPFIFQLALPNQNGDIHEIDDLDDFLFFNLKIIQKKDLTRKDLEYDLMRVLS